jgi:hypothetical protein
MSASSYGIVVEGVYDSAVYVPIIQKLSPNAPVVARECEGRPNLMKTFPGLLKTFEHEIAGRPVDMAIVIRDTDGKNPEEIEARMHEKIASRVYPFPLNVRFFAIPQAMEAWLLADIEALNSVSLRRGGKRVTKVPDNPEDLHNPKASLRQLLSDHNLPYTTALAREIAEQIDLNRLSQVCPRFRIFSKRVDC